jgi:hypothetical protein
MDADIYVLAKNRNSDKVIQFLEKHLPKRRYRNERLEFWNDSEKEENQTSIFFDSESEFFIFLEKQSRVLFRASFYPISENEVRGLHLYYFEDNSLVFGINIHQNQEKEDLLLRELKNLLKSDHGYISYHIPPAHGEKKFIKITS